MKRKSVLLITIYLILALCKIAYASTQEKELLAPEVQAGLHASIIDPIVPHLVNFASQDQANAWLTDMSGRLKKWVPDPFLRKRYLTTIQYEATRAGLDPQLVLSVITVESLFDKYAISSVGARGLMQVAPFWIQEIGTSSQDLFDISTNLRYGCTILRYYIQIEHGNIARALERYNGSLGSYVYPAKVNEAYNKYWVYNN